MYWIQENVIQFLYMYWTRFICAGRRVMDLEFKDKWYVCDLPSVLWVSQILLRSTISVGHKPNGPYCTYPAPPPPPFPPPPHIVSEPIVQWPQMNSTFLSWVGINLITPSSWTAALANYAIETGVRKNFLTLVLVDIWIFGNQILSINSYPFQVPIRQCHIKIWRRHDVSDFTS